MANPDSISGLILWLEADAIVGLADGDPVVTWEDSHTTNNDATQATSAKRPIYKTAQVNSLPAVRFDGVDDWLGSNASVSDAAQTVFVVFNPGASISLTETLRGSSAAGGLQFRVESSGALRFVKQNTAEIGTGTTGVITSAAWQVGTGSYSDTADTYAFWDAGTAAGNGTQTQSLTAARTTYLGTNAGANEFLSGDIAEVIVYDSVLSAGDRATVHSYIQDKYGITVSDYTSGGTSHSADAALTATDTVTTTAYVDRAASVSLAETATITPTAYAERPADAALTGAATLSATAVATRPADAALTTTATITADATIAGTVTADAALTGTGTVASTAYATRPTDAALTVTGTLVTTADLERITGLSFTGTATLAATATVEHSADAALTVTATIATTGDTGNPDAVPGRMTLTTTGAGMTTTATPHGTMTTTAS